MYSDRLKEFLVYYFMPPLILLSGLIGNSLGFYAFQNIRLIKIGPRLIYKCLFIIDTLNLLNIIIMFLANGFSKDVTLHSNASCKTFMYLSYTLAPISPMLLIANSIMKLVSINKECEKMFNFCKQRITQLLFIASLVSFNIIFYIPSLFYMELSSNSSDFILETTSNECSFIDSRKQKILFAMDLFNRVIIPFTLLTICTISLIRKVVRLRKEIVNSVTIIENKNRNFYRDFKSTFCLINLNVFYMLLNVPLVAFLFTQISFESSAFSMSLNLYYLSYGINFYIIFITNSLFRKEFFSFLRKNESSKNETEELSLPIWI